MPLVAVQLPLILSVAILVFIATMRIDDKIEKINSKYFVVFVRHGQSVANQRSISSGWLDTPLTEKGLIQAKNVGEKFMTSNVQFDVTFSSMLARAIQTAETILSQSDTIANVSLTRNWLLNERHRGALTGRSKAENAVTENWHYRPPSIDKNHPNYDEIQHDKRYMDVQDAGEMPTTESLDDAQKRFIRYWETTIAPEMMAGKRVLVVAHKNVLRGAVKYFDGLSDEEAAALDIGNAKPFIYEFDKQLTPRNKFTYLK